MFTPSPFKKDNAAENQQEVDLDVSSISLRSPFTVVVSNHQQPIIQSGKWAANPANGKKTWGKATSMSIPIMDSSIASISSFVAEERANSESEKINEQEESAEQVKEMFALTISPPKNNIKSQTESQQQQQELPEATQEIFALTISPPKKVTKKFAGKAKTEQKEFPVMYLERFAGVPWLKFDTVPAGGKRVRLLKIRNDQNQDSTLSIDHIPTEYGFTLSEYGDITVPAQTTHELNVTWEPEAEHAGNIRQKLKFTWNGKHKLETILHGTVVVKKSKGPTKRRKKHADPGPSKKRCLPSTASSSSSSSTSSSSTVNNSSSSSSSSTKSLTTSSKQSSSRRTWGAKTTSVEPLPFVGATPAKSSTMAGKMGSSAFKSNSKSRARIYKEEGAIGLPFVATKRPTTAKPFKFAEARSHRAEASEKKPATEKKQFEAFVPETEDTEVNDSFSADFVVHTVSNAKESTRSKVKKLTAPANAKAFLPLEATKDSAEIENVKPRSENSKPKNKSKGKTTVKAATGKHDFSKRRRTGAPSKTLKLSSSAPVASSSSSSANNNVFYDEKWVEKQDQAFTRWLNHAFAPVDDELLLSSQLSSEPATYNLMMQQRAELVLRRKCWQIFHSDEFSDIIFKLEEEIEEGRLVVRQDKNLYADVGLRRQVLDLVANFNSFWVRLGLETIYGQQLRVRDIEDERAATERFMVHHLLFDDNIAKEYESNTTSGLYRDGFETALHKFTLKKFLLLIQFMDMAKSMKVVPSDPCLFTKDAQFKATRDILLTFSKEYLSGEGDITRHLGFLGCEFTHQQIHLHEFDFAVKNLATDLRDGVRLCKLIELMTGTDELLVQLRTPAISLNQKRYNVGVALNYLQAVEGLNFGSIRGGVNVADIVEGHREKTLFLIWKILTTYQIPALLDVEDLKEEINIVTNTGAATNDEFMAELKKQQSQLVYVDDEMTGLLLNWAQAICANYGVPVKNLTTSFSDGKALCLIISYYHPELLPVSAIHTTTGDLPKNHYQSEMEDANEEDAGMDSGKWFRSYNFAVGDTELESAIANEKKNFKLIYEATQELGGIPHIIRSKEMVNTIPSEPCVITFLAYLASRLMDLSHEARAAVKIQRAYRRYNTKLYMIKMQAAVQVIQAVSRRFLAKKHAAKKIAAATQIQSVFRSFTQRKAFKAELAQIIVCQSFARTLLAKRRLQQERSIRQILATGLVRRQELIEKRQFAKFTTAAVCIQSAARMSIARREFVQAKNAAVSMEAFARMAIARSNFQAQRKAAVRVQAIVRGHQQKVRFTNMVAAAVVCQKNVRAIQQRAVFVEQKKAAVVAQSLVRMFQARAAYAKARVAAIRMESFARMAIARREFIAQREAAIKMQAIVRGHQQKMRFNKLVAATVVCQKNVRCVQQRTAFVAQKESAVVIQSTFKGVVQRRQFLKLKASVAAISGCFEMIMARRQFLVARAGVIRLQAVVRGAQERSRYLAMREERIAKFTQATRMFTSAVLIQRVYRNHLAHLEALKRIESLITIQVWVRGALHRRRFVQSRRAAVTIQQGVRAWIEKRRVSATRIQTLVRGVFARREAAQRMWGLQVIQQFYRGHLVRRTQGRKMQKMRQRIYHCNRTAEEHMKLGNRTHFALDILHNSKQLTQVMDACESLDVSTRLSRVCCVRMVENHAVPIVYGLIRSCNRSQPHMELLKSALSILRNLVEYDSTVDAVITQEGWLETIVDQMQNFREKDDLFSIALRVVESVCTDNDRAMMVVQDTESCKRMQSVYKILCRKLKIGGNNKKSSSSMQNKKQSRAVSNAHRIGHLIEYLNQF
eukprot:TRINITY_DN380_c0_g1_i4.p1 TRINITY_DN380_c0_g1~~TRINITY_DN380_c0_g1_i4.p1  ORF type:complete len:1807 (+),score=729.88 TRINITY_DN380_c0_g1_i4:704-6124(+)